MTDHYREFAGYYDLMDERLKSPGREAFFRRLFREAGTKRILDCACGTGGDLLLFKRLGLNVTGSDRSPAMLREAKRKLAAAGADVPLYRLDFRELPRHFAGAFDAVVCLTSALSEVTDDGDARLALQSMRQVLQPGGIFIFDQGITDAMMANPPRYDLVVNNRDFSRLFVMDYQAEIMTITICDFIHSAAASDFRTFTVRQRIRLLDDWRQLLTETGYSGLRFYSDWDFGPYRKNIRKRLIAVAKTMG